MSQQKITMDDIRSYFSQLVFDPSDSWDAPFFSELTGASGSSSPVNPQHVVPRNFNNSSAQSRTNTSTKQGTYENTDSKQSRGDDPERRIPLRSYNPLVPILIGPRTPLPRETTEINGDAPGVRCVGCGMAGHSTYTCPYFNIPLCYGCKRFGHRRSQCQPDWVKDLPGDKVMPSPPEKPPDSALPKSRFASNKRPEEGNELRISCSSR